MYFINTCCILMICYGILQSNIHQVLFKISQFCTCLRFPVIFIQLRNELSNNTLRDLNHWLLSSHYVIGRYSQILSLEFVSLLFKRCLYHMVTGVFKRRWVWGVLHDTIDLAICYPQTHLYHVLYVKPIMALVCV